MPRIPDFPRDFVRFGHNIGANEAKNENFKNLFPTDCRYLMLFASPGTKMRLLQKVDRKIVFQRYRGKRHISEKLKIEYRQRIKIFEAIGGWGSRCIFYMFEQFSQKTWSLLRNNLPKNKNNKKSGPYRPLEAITKRRTWLKIMFLKLFLAQIIRFS